MTNKANPAEVSKEEMLFNLGRIKRHVPFDVWIAIKRLVERHGHSAGKAGEKETTHGR